MVVKQIKNVLLCLSLINLTGCASLSSILPSFGKEDVKPITVNTVAVEKTRLNIDQPEPLKAPTLKWIIITPENAEKTFDVLKGNKVLFAITDEGYQDLSMLMAEIRAHINAQRVIILKYKEYYEPAKKEVQ